MKNSKLPFSLAVGAAFALALGIWQVAQAQQDTIHVPVTFYDFHSDRTNPEFEQPQRDAYYQNYPSTGMVADELDADGKPMLGNSPYLNHGVRFWFRDWSKLTGTTYKMAAENDPRNSGRKYLDRFRPVYRYGTNNPPGYRQTSSNEWNNNNIVMGLNQVPYAYAGAANVTVPVNNGTAYPITNNSFSLGGSSTYSIDTAFKNVVIDSFLVFQRSGNQGVYQFQSTSFFPLDNKGFERNGTGSRWPPSQNNTTTNNHNFSFTMELVWPFRYTSGQTFNFYGDDDVWVFVDNKLVLDIGGMHSQVLGEFRLDDLVARGVLNLVPNQTTTMRMFYVERHTSASNIQITTNIITTTPKELFIDVKGDTITAGVPFPATGIVYDSDDIRKTDFSKGTFTWSAVEVVGNGSDTRRTPSVNSPDGIARSNPNGSRPSTGDINLWSNKKTATNLNKSDSINLVANRAYTWIKLVGRYCEGNDCPEGTAWLYVKPGPAKNVFIENTATQASADLWTPRPLTEIRLASTDTMSQAFYAILRDSLGNWVGPARHGVSGSSNAWATALTSVATADQGAAASTLGQGRANRVSKTGTTEITVTHTDATGKPFAASSVVRLMDIYPETIKIGVKVGGVFVQVPGDSILMYIPSDSTIYVQLTYNDRPGVLVDGDGEWSAVKVSGQGSAPAGIPSGPSSSYTYSAEEQVKIKLIVKVPGSTGAGITSDTLLIDARYRAPTSMLFFNKSDKPVSLNDTLPPVEGDRRINYPPAVDKLYRYSTTTTGAAITVTAGENVPIAAAMFGTNPADVNSWIPSPDLPPSGNFTWVIVDNPAGLDTTTVTKSTSGYEAVFRSTVAHRTHVVRATYTYTNDRGTEVTVTQDLRIAVVPGALHAIYIEREPQEVTRSSLNKPLTFTGNPPDRDTLYFIVGEAPRQVFALLRDKWGNYIAPSGGYYPYWATYYPEGEPGIKDPPTEWDSNNKAVVTAEPGSNPAAGQGLVTPIPEEEGGVGAIISAKELTFVLTLNPAKLPVFIRGYSYTELRIVKEDKPFGPNDTLKINTNETPTLIVQGKRSDCGEDGKPSGDDCWERVTGSWGTDGGLDGSLLNPPNAPLWTLDPRNPGSGKITVSRDGLVDGSPGIITVDLPTVIKLGPPDSARVFIITPAKAGDPILAEIRYYNRTGEMTSWDPSWNSTTDRATFGDNLGLGRTTVTPTVQGEGDTATLCYAGRTGCTANARLAPDPNTGRDTVTFLLYNATDNPHRLSYDETIEGKKLPTAYVTLNLLPGDPVEVFIKVDGKDPGDTLNLRHEEVVVMETIGVDKWGNETGPEASKWCKDGNIPPSGAKCDSLKQTIVYDTKEATESGCGNLTATPGGSIRPDQVIVCIDGVKISMEYAYTRDYDGDGYLDAVEVTFAAPVKLAKTFDAVKDTGLINLRNRTPEMTFHVQSIKIDGKVVTLSIDDSKFRGKGLQTGWTPTLEIVDGLISDVGFNDREVRDGAAPVISSAKRYFNNGDDRRLDYVRVIFSEKVQSNSGPFNENTIKNYRPDTLFQIWDLKDAGMSKVRAKKLSKSAVSDPNRYDPVPEALVGILDMTYRNDSTLEFKLSNGFDLGPPSNYINILAYAGKEESSQRSVVRDGQLPANVTDTNNRRVPITYGNDPPERMIPVPNPASPDKSTVGNSGYASNGKGATSSGTKSDAYKYIGAYHNPDAIPHIKRGGGGAVFQVPVKIVTVTDPNTGLPYKIRCQVKVYDLAGNLVSSGEESDMLNVPGQSLSADGVTYTQMHLFWSGYNSKGMKAAPGTYRIIVQLSYPNSNEKNKKFTGTVGIAK